MITFMKMASISRSNLCRLETVFFHSVRRYHLTTCRPEFYYECDWNGARIIVIVQQTKK